MIIETVNYLHECSTTVLVVYYFFFILFTFFLYTLTFNLKEMEGEVFIFIIFIMLAFTPISFLIVLGFIVNNISIFLKSYFKKRYK